MSAIQTQRRIFKGPTTTQTAIRDLLTIVFANEVLVPGARLVIVAPWISDVPIFDNRAAEFSGLNPEWSQKEIGLVEVLLHLARAGTRLDIATRTDDHNQRFIRRMRDQSEEAGVGDSVRLVEIENLHTKGILADTWVILGSMNLTRNGIEINEEFVAYDMAANVIADARVNFDLYFNLVAGEAR